MTSIRGSVRWKASRAIDRLLVRSPLQAISSRVFAKRVAVLAYHQLRDSKNFENQVRYLCSSYSPIAPKDLTQWAQGSGTLPRKPVLITFDDGDRSVLEEGVPILRAYGITPIMFVVAGHLETTRPLWWDEVSALIDNGAKAKGLPSRNAEGTVRYLKSLPNQKRIDVIRELRVSAPETKSRSRHIGSMDLARLEAEGVVIGNHTVTHPCLDRCDPKTVREEIVGAHRELCNHLSSPPLTFAYPNGNLSSDAERVLHELGYELAFLFDHRLVSRKADPLRISRLRVDSATPMDRFRLILSGLHPALHRSIGRE